MSKEKRHPYVSSPGIITQVFNQFRSKFPTKVDAVTLQKLSLAPKNESVTIATLKALGFLDDEGNRTTLANDVFLKHDDSAFQTALAKVVKNTYQDLFDTHGEAGWSLSRSKLIGFFRATDETSELTATRQATTFEILAQLSGYVLQDQPSDTSMPSKKTKLKEKRSSSIPSEVTQFNEKQMGLTVRIEVNLPAQADQETYDRIFKSIREHLLS